MLEWQYQFFDTSPTAYKFKQSINIRNYKYTFSKIIPFLFKDSGNN